MVKQTKVFSVKLLIFEENKVLNSWIKRDQLGVTCFFIYLFNDQLFRMLIHPSSGACDIFVELFHVLYCSGTMRVGVTVWFGWGGVVWYPEAGWSISAFLFLYLMLNMFRILIHSSSGACNLFVKLFHGMYHTVTPTRIVPEQYNPRNN